jgi:TPP-dependent pyruvate/acetoin dehydrogenase alpha subunit
VEHERERDPVVLFRKRLEHAQLLDAGEGERMRKELLGMIDEAVELAETSPNPSAADLYANVFAEGSQEI